MQFRTVKLLTIICALSLLSALCVYGIASAQTQPQKPAAEAPERPLTPAERRGRAIYFRGETSSNREVTAMIGDIDVPASTVNCAGCHGRRGEGKTEGGVTAGNLTWNNLIKPYGHTHPNGRKHGPFTESSFAMAVVRGVDPAGNNLVVAMPRYRLSIEDMNDLIAYIKRLEFDRDPGLTAESIEIGVPLPTAPALAETGQSIRQVLSAYFDELNSQGGIYNRKIKLHFTETSATDPAAGLRAMISNNQIFAFVAGLSAGADRQIASLAREEEIPFIGPATLLPQVEQPPNRYLFYLLPGVSQQASALVNFADQQFELKKQRTAIVFPTTELSAAAGETAFERAKQAAGDRVVKLTYANGDFDANKLAQQLKTDGTTAVFLLGSSNEVGSFIQAANALQWTPYVFSLGVFASRDLAGSLPASFTNRVFLSFPTVPSDVKVDGLAEYGALSEKYKFQPKHTAAQVAALAAAKVFVEALKRAGADLSREQLITALESLYEYDTALTPKLIFGPNRRIGAAGAYVVTVDSAKKEFVSASGWVPAN
ncbi:MAG TPA: ABC transporter substrate-binding protein [Pyrinomonadaceae bacterium]|nr:ABC transporter substrate-binding protein [Pyrinomonadaceae bacterium]